VHYKIGHDQYQVQHYKLNPHTFNMV
jgi:hypothetical protein